MTEQKTKIERGGEFEQKMLAARQIGAGVCPNQRFRWKLGRTSR